MESGDQGHSEDGCWSLHVPGEGHYSDDDDDNDDYYLQINTDPMQSQLAYLDIVEPPSILSTDTSADQRVGLDTSASWSYLELSRAN